MYNESEMDVSLAVLADYAIVSQDGKLSIMGIFDSINPHQPFPFSLPQMYLVVAYTAGAAEYGSEKDVEIVLLSEDGRRLLSLKQKMVVPRPEIPGSLAQMNQIAGLSRYKFTEAGSYEFSILVGGEEKGSVPLRVNPPDLQEEG